MEIRLASTYYSIPKAIIIRHSARWVRLYYLAGKSKGFGWLEESLAARHGRHSLVKEWRAGGFKVVMEWCIFYSLEQGSGACLIKRRSS